MKAWASLQSWILTAFALPLGFQALASIDGRLTFGPLLERAILNYDKVLVASWLLVGNVLGFDPTGVEGVLTFYLMLLSVCLFAACIDRVSPEQIEESDRKSYFIEVFSQALLMTVLAGYPAYGLFPTLFLYSVLFFGFLLASFRRQRPALTPVGAFVSVSLVMLLVFLLALGLPRPWNSDANSLAAPLWGGLAIAVGLVNNAVGVDKLFFSRAVVAAAGIFLVDFGHRIIIPSLDMFLKAAGA